MDFGFCRRRLRVHLGQEAVIQEYEDYVYYDKVVYDKNGSPSVYGAPGFTIKKTVFGNYGAGWPRWRWPGWLGHPSIIRYWYYSMVLLSC